MLRAAKTEEATLLGVSPLSTHGIQSKDHVRVPKEVKHIALHLHDTTDVMVLSLVQVYTAAPKDPKMASAGSLV